MIKTIPDNNSINEYTSGWPPTIAHGFLHTVKNHPDVIASRTVDGNDDLTWQQVFQQVETMAANLKRMGVKKGDTIAIMLKNRPEFLIADLSAICIGAVPFSIYATLPVAQMIPVIENSDAKLIICEQAFLPKIQEVCETYKQLKDIILIEGGGIEDTKDWSKLLEKSEDFDLTESINTVSPEDLCTIIYTSGTTGPAKGVELTHSGLVELVRTNNMFLDLFPNQRFISWLPLAGMAERITSHYQSMLFGGTTTFCDDPQLVINLLPKINPQIFFSPPRIWEKIKEVIETRWLELPESEQEKIHHALSKNIMRVELEQRQLSLSDELVKECKEYDIKYFEEIRNSIGLGSERLYITSGGAAASPELLKFFYAIGLPLDECYGQTESCALGTRNPRNAMKIGSIGKAQLGIELKLATDGEILIKSPAIMRSYRKQPEKTAEVIDKDGWLHTGDIGEEDKQGYYKIVDRKKDMIINSFGKNMSPVNIEFAITDAGKFIAQAIVVGDARRYNVALVTLNSVPTVEWAKRNKIPHSDNFEKLIKDPRLISKVQSEVDSGNEMLARVEQIKKVAIVGPEWLPGDEEITPTMKLKRPVIEKRYRKIIESLFI